MQAINQHKLMAMGKKVSSPTPSVTPKFKHGGEAKSAPPKFVSKKSK